VRITRTLIVVAATAGMLGAPLVPDGRAAGPTRCRSSIEDTTLDPGVGREPSSGTFQNETIGTVECDGPVHGRQPTGPGQWVANIGHYGTERASTCAGGGGDYIYDFTLPTRDGVVRFGLSGEFVYGPAKGGVYGGELMGRDGHGTFTFTPTKGDCASTPVTAGNVTANFELTR
jgi:hypothetical protein